MGACKRYLGVRGTDTKLEVKENGILQVKGKK